MQCRFGGHTQPFYSVAQHSVSVAFRCSPENSFSGLMHDAAEAYIGDFPSPLKADPSFAFYNEVEHRLMTVISERFDVQYPLVQEVKEVDLRMLETERRDLLDPGDEETIALWAPWTEGVIPYEEQVIGMPPLGAELTFLKMFEMLGGEA